MEGDGRSSSYNPGGGDGSVPLRVQPAISPA